MRKFKFEKIDSTNEYLKNKDDLAQWDTAIADVQTDGKGRRGNKWISPKGAALFSFALREDKLLTPKDYSLLPLIAGRAMVEGLKNIENLDYKFKWPNDIYLNDKKISGILIEKVGEFYIIGMGININNEEFGENNNGTSLTEATGKKYDIEEIVDMQIMIFKKTWARYVRGQWERLLGEINNMNFLCGKTINIETGSEILEGTAKNITFDGTLELETMEGLKEVIAGEVSIKL
jgi:BirA family biotin operon repressor/biotin-[acetyl-CoA-carboxylase] ligase